MKLVCVNFCDPVSMITFATKNLCYSARLFAIGWECDNGNQLLTYWKLPCPVVRCMRLWRCLSPIEKWALDWSANCYTFCRSERFLASYLCISHSRLITEKVQVLNKSNGFLDQIWPNPLFSCHSWILLAVDVYIIWVVNVDIGVHQERLFRSLRLHIQNGPFLTKLTAQITEANKYTTDIKFSKV